LAVFLILYSDLSRGGVKLFINIEQRNNTKSALKQTQTRRNLKEDADETLPMIWLATARSHEYLICVDACKEDVLCEGRMRILRALQRVLSRTCMRPGRVLITRPVDLFSSQFIQLTLRHKNW